MGTILLGQPLKCIARHIKRKPLKSTKTLVAAQLDSIFSVNYKLFWLFTLGKKTLKVLWDIMLLRKCRMRKIIKFYRKRHLAQLPRTFLPARCLALWIKELVQSSCKGKNSMTMILRNITYRIREIWPLILLLTYYCSSNLRAAYGWAAI